jgi:hypothetical protein
VKSSLVLAGAVCIVSLTACAKEHQPPPAPLAPVTTTSSSTEGKGTLEQTKTVTVTARVVAIDQKKRLVTLRGPDGKLVEFVADERVKNLPQVRKGDLVVTTYYESVEVQLKKRGKAKPSVTAAEGVATAAPGQMPAGVGAQTVTVIAKITAIDGKEQSVTLTGPKGKSVTVKVKDPKHLAGVKVGDLVEVTYTQALAIAVEKAAKTN